MQIVAFLPNNNRNAPQNPLKQQLQQKNHRFSTSSYEASDEEEESSTAVEATEEDSDYDSEGNQFQLSSSPCDYNSTTTTVGVVGGVGDNSDLIDTVTR